jgi:NAD(P) transhydrogenase subunit alpha
VITTALIPGRPAPLLLPEDTVEGMKPGSVIVDLAGRQGGNCALSEVDRCVTKYGVKVLAPPTFRRRWRPMPARCMRGIC